MKSLKIVGIVIGALVLLAALAVTAALNSSVQTWAVRKALAGQPGMTIEVAKVNAGLSSAEVSGLRVVQDGLALSAQSVTTRYSAWAYLSGRRLEIDELVVKDLAVDLRPAPPTASAGIPAAAPGRKTAVPAKQSQAPAGGRPDAPKPSFGGLLTQAKLPLELRLDRLAVNGRAELPDQQKVGFEFKGTDIAAGKRSRLEWTLDYTDASPGAPIRTVRSIGTMTVRLTPDRRVDAIEVDSTASATGPKIPSDQLKISFKAAQPKSGGDEDYAVGLDLVRATKIEQLVSADARFASTQRELAGNWNIALRSEQLAALLAGFGLPEIAANGSGKFTLKPDIGAATASGSLRASAAQLQKLDPALAALGSVQIKSSFDGSLADNAAHLNEFEVTVADGAGRRFAHVNLLQRVSYRLTDRHISFADSKAEAARVSLQAVPLAWAQALAKPLQIESGSLSMALAIEAEPDGSRVRARATEPLTLRSITIRDAQKKALIENLTLSMRPSVDYAPAKLTAQLAEVTLAMTTGDSLTGNVSAEVTNLATKPVTAFRAQLQARLVTLVKPFLAFDPGTLTAAIEASGQHEGDTVQLTKASATVNREGGALLGAIELQQSVRANLKAATFAVAQPEANAARVRLGEIPLAWIEPYVVKSKIVGTLAGATLDLAMRSPEDLSLATVEAVTLRGVSATLDGKSLVQGVDLSASLSATKRKDTLSFDLRRLELKQGPATLVALATAGEAKLGGATVHASAKGNLEADLGALLAQPALVQSATLARGRFAAAFEATVGDTSQAKAVISARGLVAKQGNQTLGDLELALTASLKADGSGTISAPLTIVNGGRKSDLQFTGSFGKASDQTTFLFSGKLASANLVVDDLQMLAGLAPASEPAKPAATRVPSRPGKPGRDKDPFWKGVNGRAEVDLKRILYGKDYTIRGIRGTATIANSKLSLDGLEGSFRDKPFKLASAISFSPAQAQPYTLTGMLDVSGVDVGEFLRAATPGEKPMLETVVKVSAKLNGSGGNLPELIERTYGTFDVAGSKGVLRALGRKGETVGAASTLLGLAGALAGSQNTVSLGRLGQELEEMQFETFSLKIERDAALNMKFSNIEFLSSNKRLTGSGSLNYIAGASYDQWPFQFEFKLAGKDFMAQLLNEARVLAGNQDEKGFYPMAMAFPVSGTAAKVNNGLWKILAGTAARAGLEGLLRR